MGFTASVQILGVAVIGLTLITYGIRLLLIPKPLPDIPYNPISATRLLGDAPDLFGWGDTSSDGAFSYLTHLSQKLNSPIFQIFLRPLGKPWVILMDPRESHDIMTRRFKEFDRSEFFGDNFKGALPEFHVHMPTGEKWHAHRRMMNDTMSPWFLHGVAGPLMWGATQSLVELWREKARLANGRPFKATSDMHKATLDIFWAATFGQETGSNKAQTALLKQIQTIGGKEDVDAVVVLPETHDPPDFTSIMILTESMDIPISSLFPRQHHWLALRLYPRLAAARKRKDKLIQTKLGEARLRLSSNSVKDIEYAAGLRSALDLVVAKEIKAAEKQGRPPKHDSQGIQDELFGFLIAGHETTSTMLAWTLKVLTGHQDVQKRLRDALRAEFKRAQNQSGQPSIEDITSSHIAYLEALIEEIGRYGTPAIGKVRKTLNDTVILGHSVPKGVDVFMMNNGPGFLMPALQVKESKRSRSSQEARDKTPAWREDDVAEFKPDRWLVQDEKGEVTFNPNAGPNMPFGAGPRACFGKKWALLELKVLIVLIVWNFELLPLPAELFDYRAIDGLTHRPEKVHVRLRALT